LTKPEKNSSRTENALTPTRSGKTKSPSQTKTAPLPEYIREAVATINREEQRMGRPPKLDLEKKVNLFVLARLLSKSNRGMEEALEFFQPLFGVDVSYKYIERLYSDQEVKLTLHNVFVLLLKEEGTTGDLAGDGTGYSVRVESHYRTDPKKRGKKYLHFFSNGRGIVRVLSVRALAAQKVCIGLLLVSDF